MRFSNAYNESQDTIDSSSSRCRTFGRAKVWVRELKGLKDVGPFAQRLKRKRQA
jgi:hypothetical protein